VRTCMGFPAKLIGSVRSDHHGIWVRPDCFPARKIESVHCDAYLRITNFYHQVVIVHVFALEWIIGCPLDRVGMGAASSRHEVSDSAMLVPLVVVNMTIENDHPKQCVGLALRALRE